MLRINERIICEKPAIFAVAVSNQSKTAPMLFQREWKCVHTAREEEINSFVYQQQLHQLKSLTTIFRYTSDSIRNQRFSYPATATIKVISVGDRCQVGNAIILYTINTLEYIYLTN